MDWKKEKSEPPDWVEEPLPENYIEDLGKFVEDDDFLNYAIGRERIHDIDARTARMHEDMDFACSNNAFADYIMKSVFRADEKVPQMDQEEPVTKKRKLRNPPQGLDVSDDPFINPNWVSVFELVNSTELETDYKKKMLKKAMDLEYKDHLKSLGMIFPVRGTQYQPNHVFGICNKMRLNKKVNDTNDSKAVTIAEALLKATFCTGPQPEDKFVFQTKIFTNVVLSGRNFDE